MNRIFKMHQLTKLIVATIVIVMAQMSFAAGDYVWEAKFAKELPKAEKGNLKSQYAIGEMYEKGKGTEPNTKNAFKWYIKAAGKGNKKAAYKVGLFYYKGMAVTKDYKKARTWFSKSAEKKYVRAQYYLGEIYENGRGVSRNYTTALKWYKLALAGGYGAASESVKRVASAQGSSKKSSRSKSKRKAPPTVTDNSAEKTVATILKGGWKKRKRPVEYLPSSVNDCKRTGRNLECESDLLTRNIGMADIAYTTKAIIFSFKSDGRFKVSYRNNVKTIKVTDEEFAESGGKVPVKLGWQDAEHKLTCDVNNSKSISCTKNKTRKFKLTR